MSPVRNQKTNMKFLCTEVVSGFPTLINLLEGKWFQTG